VAGLGKFDCHNTAAATKGNQCNGVSPFPSIDISSLEVFGTMTDESLLGASTTLDDAIPSSGTNSLDDVAIIDDAWYEPQEASSGWYITWGVSSACIDRTCCWACRNSVIAWCDGCGFVPRQWHAFCFCT
jgi:hypothetical protein